MSSAGTAAATGDTGTTGQATGMGAGQTSLATGQQPTWYATLPPEVIGDLQNRGLDKKTALDAALDYHKAHGEAQKLISRITGTPDKDRILITPKPDSTEAEKNAFYEKLGRPAKPEDYDFAGVKKPDGSDLEDGYRDFLRASAFKANMSKESAAEFARGLLKFQGDSDAAKSTENAFKLQAEQAALKANWGPNEEANKFIAKQAAAKLGITPEAVSAMEKAAGYKAVMEAFLKIGIATGEAKFIGNQAPGMTGIMTKEQATATMSQKKQERGPDSFGAKLARGDTATINEFNALTAMMVGQEAPA